MMNKKEPDTDAPIIPPTSETVPMREYTVNETAIAISTATTIVECPMLKNRPTVTGRWNPGPLRSGTAMMRRVALSMAEMWSASSACRRPVVHATSAKLRSVPVLFDTSSALLDKSWRAASVS